jgi:DNA polymerase/3'-5' exonuclease PolX
MKLNEAKATAEKYQNLFKPYCSRIEIAGSSRREKPEVKDIEIVATPGDIESFAKEVNKLQKVKGEPTGKYTQRILPEGINLVCL